MASYLRNWWYPSLQVAESQESVPAPPTVIPPDDEDEDSGSATEREPDDDTPPAFPAINSAQRAKSSTAITRTNNSNGVPKILTDSTRMPPPPAPGLAVRTPGVTPASSSRTRPSQSPVFISTLNVPSSSTSTLSVPLTTTKAPKKQREKVALAPGHGALDWANLKSSGADLRGVDTLMRIPPSVLKQHNKKHDAWTAISGKVYNITAYLPYHPGGEKELMRVAGRDGTKLFALTHAWVSADMMLDTCMVGFLVPEPARDDDD